MPKQQHTPPSGMVKCGAAILAALQVFAGGNLPAFAQNSAAPSAASNTRTPIKHVIVIIGENRTFDHIFATYKPVKGQTVDNLLSKRIINETELPGPTSPSHVNPLRSTLS